MFDLFKDVVKTNPKCGDIVRVNFEGKIFRGIVHDKCNETYKVFLMDIGKNEDIVADNIFELSNDLKNVCTYCFMYLTCYFIFILD